MGSKPALLTSSWHSDLNEIASGLRFNVPEKFNLQLNLDYAFLWPLRIEESLGTHRVSLTYRF